MRKFRGNKSGSIFTEIFSDEKGILLEGGSVRNWWSNKELSEFVTEIKEPVKLTVWKNVWQRKNGSYLFGCDWPDEQSAKRDAYDIRETIKYIKTVKFEVEIEQ